MYFQVSEVAETFIVSVYNPLSWSVSPYIRCIAIIAVINISVCCVLDITNIGDTVFTIITVIMTVTVSSLVFRIPVPSPSYTVHDQSGPLQVQVLL